MTYPACVYEAVEDDDGTWCVVEIASGQPAIIASKLLIDLTEAKAYALVDFLNAGSEEFSYATVH